MFKTVMEIAKIRRNVKRTRNEIAAEKREIETLQARLDKMSHLSKTHNEIYEDTQKAFNEAQHEYNQRVQRFEEFLNKTREKYTFFGINFIG